MSNILKDTLPAASKEASQGSAMDPDSKACILTGKSTRTAEMSSDQAAALHSTAATVKEGLAETANNPSKLAMIQPGTAGPSTEKPVGKAKKSVHHAISKKVVPANVSKGGPRGKQKAETTKNRVQKTRIRMSRKEAARKREWLINHREALYQQKMEQNEKFTYDLSKTPRATAEETELFEEYLAMNPDSDNDDGW